MAAFGVETPSVVVEGTALSPNSTKAVVDKLSKQSEQAKTGLATPAGTPDPDTERLEADRARQHAEAGKASSNGASPEKSSSRKAAPTKVDRGKPEVAEKKNQKGKSSETAPSGPAKTSTDAQEEFAPNAEGDEESDNESSATDLMQDEAPTPSDFHIQKYEEATPCLIKLMENPNDEGAISYLQSLNRAIHDQNVKDKLPSEDFCIRFETFNANFELAKVPLETLKAHPADDKARKTLTTINETLRQLNERHGYPKDWIIGIPPESGVAGTGSVAVESSGAAAPKVADKAGKSSTKGGVKTKVTTPKVADKAGKSSTKGGVKTKVAVAIPDESDGRTTLGKVVYVRKAGHGSRVIVNRGTEENPYFNVHPGAAFGKGVAKEWQDEEIYRSEDLPKDTTAKEMRIYGRVKVERRTKKLDSKTGRTNNEIQYYLIKVGEVEYLSTRSALSGKKGLSPAKLDRIDAQLNRQNELLLEELDQCREKNEHPDTGEQLTSADIEEMPWLSPDAIVETQDEDSGDKDDDGDIGDIVPQRAGLKRTSKPKPASGTRNSTNGSRSSIDSEL